MDKDKRIKELELELEKSNKLINQFKGLLNSIPDPVFMKDEKLLWIYGNPTILKLYNIDPNNYIGKAEDELLPEEFAQSCMQSDEKARDAKTVSKSQERARDENGELHYYEVFKVPNYENDEFKGLIGVGRDITKTKEYQEKLEVALKEQKKLNYKSRLATLGEMLENITHQWKQPLQNISMISSTNKFYIENNIKNSDESIKKSYDDISENVTFMNNTIEVFKDYFKEETQEEKFTLKDLIDSALVICKGTLNNGDININIILEEDVEVFGNKNELIHTIINILTNAKDALVEKNIENRLININGKRINNSLELKIEDNAKGIPENIIDKIFESHFTTKKENGTGIGLYLCKKIIIENYKGSIKAYNKNDGAVFEINIPL